MSQVDATEAEWQFDTTDLQRVARWLESPSVPGYTVRPGPTRHLRDLYFDAADWRIHRAGFTARVRDKGDGAIITLKSMAAARDGLRQRREIEEAIPVPDLAHVEAAPGACGRMVRLIAGRYPLRSLFVVETERRLFDLLEGETRLGEIAVDDTAFSGPGSPGPAGRLARIEVEVDATMVDRARRFVDVLAAAGELSPASLSKFEAGLASCSAGRPGPPDLGPTKVTPELTAAEAAYAVLRRHLGVLLVNEPGTRLGEDIEALHDMRVAARRLRAALAAFAPFLSPTVLRYRTRLAWVGQVLGEVRDLDVHLEEFASYHSELAPQEVAGLQAIEAILSGERDAARQRMLRALDSRRYRDFVVSFGAVLRRGPARSFAPGAVPVVQAAPALLRRRYRGMRKLGDAIVPESPPTDYHALRITGKKLRYALEFLGPIYGKPATDLSIQVTALQELLGRHQDLEIAAATLRRVATVRQRLGVASLIAVGVICERHRGEGERLRQQFPAVYRTLRGKAWRSLEEAFAKSATRRPAGSPGRTPTAPHRRAAGR